MEIGQKRLSNIHTFTFKSDTLNFAYRDKSGSGEVEMSYADLPLKSSTRIDQNLWLKNVGYLWSVLGTVEIGYAISTQKSLAGTGFWLFFGLGCLLWAHFTKVIYSVFSSAKGSVWIIQDGKTHDRIIEEIRSRRKNQLLAWLGDINLENGLEKEIVKFRWLAEQQALTTEEAEQRIAQLEATLRTDGLLPPVTLN